MGDNRAALAASSSRIDTLETQLARGSRRITADTVSRFGELLSARLRDEDSTLRTAYLRLLVSAVSVSRDEIVISGPTAALETGISNGVPRLEGTVPIFDRKWCPEELSAEARKRLIYQSNHRLKKSPEPSLARSEFVEKAGCRWT